MDAPVAELKDAAPNIGAAYEITVFDKDGKVKQVIVDDAKCYVQNFLRMVRNWFLVGDGNSIATSFVSLTGILTSATSVIFHTGPPSVGTFSANAAAGDITSGIVVGTGNVAVIADDYKLGNVITHGTGVGQLSYDAVSFLPNTISGNTITITLARMVSNATTGAVVISEIGLYRLGTISIMTLRDVISPSVTLNSGESALIAYKQIING